MRDQGIRVASRCLWDTSTDNYASVIFKNVLTSIKKINNNDDDNNNNNNNNNNNSIINIFNLSFFLIIFLFIFL